MTIFDFRMFFNLNKCPENAINISEFGIKVTLAETETHLINIYGLTLTCYTYVCNPLLFSWSKPPHSCEVCHNGSIQGHEPYHRNIGTG